MQEQSLYAGDDKQVRFQTWHKKTKAGFCLYKTGTLKHITKAIPGCSVHV